MKIAVIGLGAMGAATAGNLLRSGNEVSGGIRDRRAGRAAGRRRRPETSIAAAVAGADADIGFVVNARQVEAAIVLGADGVAASIGAGGAGPVRIVSATFIEGLGEHGRARGIALVDAPVSAVSAAPAAARRDHGERPVDAMARGLPLDQMGRHVYDFGDRIGAGSMVKTINQLFCGVHLAVLGEAIALGRRAGLDPAKLLEVYGNSAAASWMMKDRGGRALEATPPANSAIDIFVKDLALVLDAGRDLKFPLPVAMAAHHVFLAASAGRQGRASTIRISGRLTWPCAWVAAGGLAVRGT